MSKLKVMKNLMAPMRDGVLLSCDVYRPEGDERYPAILMRTPYLKEKFADEWLYSDYEELALSGYNVVIQDVRGVGASEGVLLSSGGSEVDDGFDTVEWVAAQDWCDGNVGMYGLSYFGFTQMAAASQTPPHLKAICPFQNAALFPLSISKSLTLGCYHLMWLYGRVLDNLERYGLSESEKEHVREQISYYQKNWEEVMFRLPLRETPAAQIEGAPLLKDYIELVDGVEDDRFWEKARRPVPLWKIEVPMFFLTGWFDAAKDGTFDNYHEVMTNGTATAKEKSRLIVGPWQHGGMLAAKIDGMDFGEENSGRNYGIQKMTREWFDHWLKGKELAEYAPVSVFVLGVNKWREEKEWPLARTQYTDFYIHSGETKNTGILNKDVPGEEPAQNYIYDPEDPLPSNFQDKDGHTVFADPKVLEAREDVLVYLSDPLSAAMEVTGCVKFVLYAKTSAVDTDFFCRISDTDPNGRSFPLLHGIVRAKFRNGRTPEPVVPGEVYTYEIELGCISNVFRQGHRIRLEISSSSYPENDRNLNTGERVGHGRVSVKAQQTIFHDSQYPSRLILPVIPE